MDFRPRHIFLRIEQINDYSPLAPEICSRRYGRDCMYGDDHELGHLSPDEIRAAALDGLVYREYLDPHYMLPQTAKIIGADVVDGTVRRRDYV